VVLLSIRTSTAPLRWLCIIFELFFKVVWVIQVIQIIERRAACPLNERFLFRGRKEGADELAWLVIVDRGRGRGSGRGMLVSKLLLTSS
jgi:hypothetical protein